MTTDPKRTPPPLSPDPRKDPKSTLVAIARNALGKTVEKQPAPPSRAAIESRAFEIWLARGQERGHDQEHWYEAERQIQQG